MFNIFNITRVGKHYHVTGSAWLILRDGERLNLSAVTRTYTEAETQAAKFYVILHQMAEANNARFDRVKAYLATRAKRNATPAQLSMF